MGGHMENNERRTTNEQGTPNGTTGRADITELLEPSEIEEIREAVEKILGILDSYESAFQDHDIREGIEEIAQPLRKQRAKLDGTKKLTPAELVELLNATKGPMYFIEHLYERMTAGILDGEFGAEEAERLARYQEQAARYEARIRRNDHLILNGAGFNFEDMANVPYDIDLHTDLVAQMMYKRGEAGYCPVGNALVQQIRDGAPRGAKQVRGQSVKEAAIVSGLSEQPIYSRLNTDNPKEITVDEAARLAIAYNVTPAELLGFMDADEVRLLRLWRGMDADKRQALFTLLEP